MYQRARFPDDHHSPRAAVRRQVGFVRVIEWKAKSRIAEARAMVSPSRGGARQGKGER